MNQFNKKVEWKKLTFDEKVAVKKARASRLADPESRYVNNIMEAYRKEETAKQIKMKKLRDFLLVKRGLPPAVI